MAEPWVLPAYDSAPGSLIFDIFRACDLQRPVPQVVTLSVQLTTTLVATGRFVGMLPGSVVNFDSTRAILKRLPVKLAAKRVPVSAGQHHYGQESNTQPVGQTLRRVRS
jgi:DNA-binding transcriptional LysR family regulator